MKRGSIELARSLCEDIEGELEGEVYGSVDVAEILSAEVERLRSQLAEARDALAAAIRIAEHSGHNMDRERKTLKENDNV